MTKYDTHLPPTHRYARYGLATLMIVITIGLAADAVQQGAWHWIVNVWSDAWNIDWRT